MESDHPYKNKINTKISSESLEDTFKRVIPYYDKKIEPILASKKNVLIVFHGNSCRALLMKIFRITKSKIDSFVFQLGTSNYYQELTLSSNFILPDPRK